MTWKIFTKMSLLIALISLVSLRPVKAFAQTATPEGSVTVTIDKDSTSVVAGAWVRFHTMISNRGNSATPPLVANFNVASIHPGFHVDPEDWSPLRTQYIDTLQPGESVELAWDVHALFEGDFAIYVTIVSQEKNFEPVGSPTLHIQAGPDNVLPMNEVIPVVAIIPLFPLALLLFTTLSRRKQRSTK
jgi:hypothetical protein